MDDNKDIEKVSRTVFDNLKLDAPVNAWGKLDAELDKKQAVVYKRSANRFKLLSIILLLIIFSFTTWYFLIPTTTTKYLTNVITKIKVENNKTSSNNIVIENNSSSNLSAKILIPLINKNEPTSNNGNNNNPNLNKSHHKKLTFKVKTNSEQKNKNFIRNQKQNSVAHIIKFPTINYENSAESNVIIVNSISNEVVSAVNDSGMSNATEQNILAITFNDNGLSSLCDTNKSEPEYLVKNDSLFRMGLHSKSRLSLAVFYSPNKTWCNLKDNTNDNIDDVAMYSNRENSKLSFTTGMILKYDLNNKWSLLSGASYSLISKSITIQTLYAESNASNEMHFQYPTSNGVIEMPLDDIHTNLHPGDSINTKAVCKQIIKFVNVPLMIRFQLTKKKYTGYINAGFSANFMVQEKAKITMNNSEITIINHVNGLKKISYGFLLGAGIQYNMYDDFGIFIEPMFRGSFTSITRNTNVNSYPYSLGLNLGFSLDF